MTTARNIWLPLRAEPTRGDLRLFCFPHAGAGASAYHPWARALSPEIDVLAVEYPGRWSRHREAALTDLERLVEAAANGLMDVLGGRFAFFGYSFGSVIAFELARALRRRGLPGPEHLFVGARRAPQLTSDAAPLHALPDAEFSAAVDRRYGGLPEVLRRDPDLLRTFLGVLRSDITALERYTYRPEPALSCPITALGGAEDPQVSESQLAGWQEQTSAGFALHRFAGGHFFINTASAAILDIVRSALRAQPERGPAVDLAGTTSMRSP